MTNKHIGYGGQPYDSKAEAKVSFRFAELGCFPCKTKFQQTFKDADGTEFRACPDFYHAGSSLYLEFKAHTLNSRTTKTIADKRVAEKLEYKGVLSSFDRLNLQWNHSKAKHAIVQNVLTPQNYVVVFETPPTDVEACAYIKAGIVFIPLSTLPTYLLYVRMLKAGWNISFQLHYVDEEAGKTTLSLGPYIPDEEAKEVG